MHCEAVQVSGIRRLDHALELITVPKSKLLSLVSYCLVYTDSMTRLWSPQSRLRLACAIFLLVDAANALSCDHPCNPSTCPALPDCPSGVVKDQCSCCDACAKGLNESCGGSDNIEGRCGSGLYCKLPTNVPGLPPLLLPNIPGTCVRNETSLPNNNGNGTDCDNATTSTEEPMEPGMCRSSCTPQFCQSGANVKARICSARGLEYEHIAARDSCQHTSCHACYLLVRPSCDRLKCPAHVNKRCLRMFLSCVRDHYFTSLSEDKLLRLDDPRALTTEGRIVCHIPQLET